mgnify:CR=1 FL=1
MKRFLLFFLFSINSCYFTSFDSMDFDEGFVVKLTENNKVKIIWDKEKYKHNYHNIEKGLILKTKNDPKNDYDVIAEISYLNYFCYIDENVTSNNTYYYRIILVVTVEHKRTDANNNTITEYKTENHISTPKGVKIP